MGWIDSKYEISEIKSTTDKNQLLNGFEQLSRGSGNFESIERGVIRSAGKLRTRK